MSSPSKNEKLLQKWKEEGEPVDVVIVSRKGGETHTIVYRKSLGDGARAVRALKALGLCWLVALLCVLIPIAHFVLVPGFFIAGPVMAWLRYRHTSLVLGGIGMCPTCDVEVRVKPASEEWPLQVACDECREFLEVRRADPAAADVPAAGA